MNSHSKEWSTSPIREIAKAIIGGGTPSRAVSSMWNGDIPWVTPGELTNLRGKYLRRTVDTITWSGLASSGAQILPTRSLIVTTRATVGSRALTSKPTTTNQGFKSIIFSDAASPDFYYHFFSLLKQELKRRASGTTFLEISGKEFGDVVVPTPPLHEQRRIAEILDTLDDQIRATEQLIAKFKLAKQGLLRDMLVEPRGDFASCQVSGQLGEFVSWVSGGTPTKDNPRFWGGSVPWLTPKDMKSQVLSRTAETLTLSGVAAGSRKVSDDAVFIVVRGMILAHTFPVSMLTESSAFNQDVKAVIAGPKLLPEFLMYWFIGQSGAMLRLVGESTHGTKKIDLPDLHQFPVRIPSLSQQERIAGIIRGLDQRIDLEFESVQKLVLQKAGLMADLLTGKVRVETVS